MEILYFIGKCLLAELLIESLRYGIHAIFYNKLPASLHITHSSHYFKWMLMGLETASVIALFYIGYSLPIVVFSTLFLTFVVKYLGSLLLGK